MVGGGFISNWVAFPSESNCGNVLASLATTPSPVHTVTWGHWHLATTFSPFTELTQASSEAILSEKSRAVKLTGTFWWRTSYSYNTMTSLVCKSHMSLIKILNQNLGLQESLNLGIVFSQLLQQIQKSQIVKYPFKYSILDMYIMKTIHKMEKYKYHTDCQLTNKKTKGRQPQKGGITETENKIIINFYFYFYF